MKIKPEHYMHMRDEMVKTLDKQPAGRIQAIRESVSEKRFIWDLARASGLIPYITDVIYAYADDTHIDTAFRRIIREIDGT